MSQSINDWFASGRESGSSDDEHVEYQGRDVASGSDHSSEQNVIDAQSRGRRRPGGERPRRREAPSTRSETKVGQIRKLLVQAQRDGASASDATVVANLGRRGVNVTVVQVRRVRTALGDEARAAARSIGRSDGSRTRAAASTRSAKPRQPTKVKYFLERVEFVAPPRMAEPGAAFPSRGLERSRADPSLFWLPPARAAVVASPSRGSTEARKNLSVRSKKQKRNQASPKRGQRLPRRDLSILDAQPCPACGFRPTINGVCLC